MVVSGPSCSGKTFLIDRLTQGDCDPLCRQIGMDDPEDWEYLPARLLETVQDRFIDRLLLHYDIFGLHEEGVNFRHIARILRHCDTAVIVTQYTDPATLIERNNARLYHSLIKLLKTAFERGNRESTKERRHRLRKQIGRQWRRRRAYRDGVSEDLYQWWLEFIQLQEISAHWILDFRKAEVATPAPGSLSELNHQRQRRRGGM